MAQTYQEVQNAHAYIHYDNKVRGGITRRKTMRFNAKFTAVLAAGVLAVALTPVSPAAAKSNDTPAKQTTTQEKKQEKPAEPVKAQPKKVVVAEGDSLASIAEANQTDWVRIFNANESIANPDIINAGQELTIPTADQELPDRYSQYVATAPVVSAPVVAQTASTYTT